MAKKTDIRALIDKTQEYLPSKTLALIEDAYEFASQVYQVDKSGEPYLEHAIKTAITVAELQLDENCIAAALLHEIPEHCGVESERIKKKFGTEVAKLVEGCTKLCKISWPEEAKPKKGTIDIETQAESLRKMLMAMSEDIRVVFIKLADRLHEIRRSGCPSPGHVADEVAA